MSGPYQTSPLDPIIAQRNETETAREAQRQLLDPTFHTRAAIAAEQDNMLATEAGLARDLLVENFDTLRMKYGQDVADQAFTLRNTQEELARFRDDKNSVAQAAGDASLDFISSFVGLAGNTVGALAVRPMAWAAGVDADAASATLADFTSFVQEEIRSGRSDRAQASSQFAAIQQNLDSQDNFVEAQRAIEDGMSPWMASAQMVGKNFLDAGKNIGTDYGQAQELIAQSLGSLGPSAAIARGASILAAKGVARLTASKRAQSLAAAGAAAAAIGATEASGTYAETMQNVMDIDQETLNQSEVYQGLLEEGYSESEARVALANMTAETAFSANLPAAIALGMLTRRFETAPIGAFKGSGIVDGMRQITAQGVEEGGQSAASVLSGALAMNERADIGTSYTEGLGEEVAAGALGGIGQAGTLGAPRVALNTVAQAPGAVVAGAQALGSGAVTAAQAAQSIYESTAPARERAGAAARNTAAAGAIAAGPLADAVGERAAPVVRQAQRVAEATGQLISPAIAYVADSTINKANRKQLKANTQSALDLNEEVSTQMENLAPELQTKINEVDEPSEGFAGLQGNNVIETVAAINAKMSEKGFRPGTEDTAYAANQLMKIRQMANSLPPKAKRLANALIDTPASQRIIKEAGMVDLNDTKRVGIIKDSAITPKEVKLTKDVALTNPTNVNPDRTEKILEQNSKDFTPLQAKITRVALNASRAVNERLDTQIEIQDEENIGLSRIGEQPKKGTSRDEVSRSILAEGYESRGAKPRLYRSVNDFARDIIQGLQSPDQTVLDNDGNIIPLAQVAQEFTNFIQHMNNKVDALNRSAAANVVNKKGKRVGPSLGFRGLKNPLQFEEEANWKGSKVFVHLDNPESIATAKQVEADVRTAETVYAAIQKEFPEVFEGMNIVMPVTLTLPDNNPTAVEEETAVSDEQQKQTQEQSTPSETIDEDTPQAVSEEIVEDTIEETPPTAIDDGATGVEERTDEAQTESVNDETPVETEETDADKDLYNLLKDPSKWDPIDRVRVKAITNAARNQVRALIEAKFGKDALKRVDQVTIYPDRVEKGWGFAWTPAGKKRGEIFMNEKMFDSEGNLTKNGKNVVVHEMAHVMDFTHTRFSDDPASISKQRMFEIGQPLDQEWQAIDHNYNEFTQSRYEYVESFQEDGDLDQRQAEMWAVLTEYFFMGGRDMLANAPIALAELERIYGPRPEATRTAPESVSTENTGSGRDGDIVAIETPVETETNEQVSETTGQAVTRGFKVLGEFWNSFIMKETEGHPSTMSELEKVMADSKKANAESLNFVKAVGDVLKAQMRKRLDKQITVNGRKKTIREFIQEGQTQFPQFRGGMLVDPKTGNYDENLLDMVAVAVSDWLMNNTGSDPNRIDDTLEKLGLNLVDISEEHHGAVMNGVPPSNAVDSLSNEIMRMLDIQMDPKQKTNILQGIIHGFTKEVFTALSQDGRFVQTARFPVDTGKTDKKGNKITQMTETYLVNNLIDEETGENPLRDWRAKVQAAKTQGKAATVREVLFGDRAPIWSIGKKIETVDETQGRTNILLSMLEKRALKKMQDIPSYLDETFAQIVAYFDEGVIQDVLGFTDDETENSVLKKSIRGKNISITKNIDETTALVEALSNSGDEPGKIPVYFPFGITKVGRHQAQGPNPQSNKFMRALVTATWSVISLNNLDNFWIAVGQAADLSGVNKAEKKNHRFIIENAPRIFEETFGPAKDMMKEILKGNDIDQQAFKDAVGIVEPQQLKAIMAVAQMELARENGQTDFRTSLSFELDGLTNGVANMMVNFAQGVISPEMFENFQRVGLYLGKTGKAVNDYFAQKTSLDMYETVARLGDQILMRVEGLEPWQLEQRKAAIRLAGIIGNFDPDTGQMTRNSAKNPMTKINYGSGVRGVAVGIADDMLIKFYEDLQKKPENVSLDEFYYPGFTKDMNALGLKIGDKPSKKFNFPSEQVNKFRTSIQFSIGKALTEATKAVIGHEVGRLNDVMVMSTNIQARYLQKIYDAELEKLAEDLAKQDKVGRNSKTGKARITEVPLEEIRKLEDRLMTMAPIFVSDDQSLLIGGFTKQRADDFRTSTNFDREMTQGPQMRRPDDVGVRAIPFSVIGTGDAMMMNLIFGSDGAPDDVLGIFDGLDIPLDKIQEYAPYVNQQVAKSWDRDVLSMVQQNFNGFLNNPEVDRNLLEEVVSELASENKNPDLNFATSADAVGDFLTEALRQNRAFKQVMKETARTVDQMGGSSVGWSSSTGEERSPAEINTRIQRLLEGKNPDKKTDVKAPVFVTTVGAHFQALKLNDRQLKVINKLMQLDETGLMEAQLVMGTVEQVRDWMQENMPNATNVMRDVKGGWDVENRIMYLATNDPETFIHEFVHAATFNTVLDHYEGNGNKWVKNLEDLMVQFLNIESKGQNIINAQVAISRHWNKTDPWSKAAAVNEYMAWALSNSQITKRLKSEEASFLSKMSDAVLNLMRRLMGAIPTDMFNQTVFNTHMMMTPHLEKTFGEEGGNGDGGDGNNGGNGGGESTPLGNNHTDYWIQTLENWVDQQDLGSEEGRRRISKLAINQANADRVLDSLRQAGMLRNANDRATFRAIYGILKSEMVLDPNSLIALTKVFQHVEENMTPEMFGSTPEDAQTYSAVLNSFGAYKTDDTSDAVAVLFALSQTSKKFRDVMDQIPAPETGEIGSGLNDFLVRGTNMFMRKLMGTISTESVPQEVLDGLKKTIVDHHQEKEFAILEKLTGGLNAADRFVKDQLTNIAETMRDVDAQARAGTRGTIVQYLTSALTYTTNFLDKPGTELNAQMAQRSVYQGIPILSLVPIRELIDEFVGTNRDNKDFVAMLDVVNSRISGVRQAFRENLPELLNKLFSTPPVAQQWKSMQRTLGRTDFTRFLDLANLQSGMQFLEESGRRQNQIQFLEQQLQSKMNPTDFQDAIDKSKQLADYMNGKRVGTLLIRNAYAISQNLEGDYGDDVVALIDELTTFYAIDTMDADIREDTVQLWQNEPKAIMAIVSYMQQLNDAEDQKAVSEQAKLNGFKGYVPNLGAENHRIIVAKDSDEEEMLHRGYKKIAPFTGDVNNAFARSYYVTNISQQGQYSQGIMQNVSSTYRGVDINTGLTVTGDATSFISDPAVVNRIMEELLDPTYTPEDENEVLMPVFDEDKTILGFERSINPVLTDKLLGREENFAINIGAWAGRQVEEELSTQWNMALVDKLDAMWQNREAGTENLFTNMKKTKDPIYAESFKLIPQNIKSYMDGKFDGNGMMVMTSMANLSVGYREASIADLWTGKTRMPKELQNVVKAVTRQQFGETSLRTLLVKGEQGFQSLVSDAKDIIVVKSLIVPIVNTQANIIQLATSGVPLKTIQKQYRSKLAEITEFNKNHMKIMELENQYHMTQDPRRQRLIRDKIQVMKDLNAKMTIAPMIAAGAYKQISEGIEGLDRAQTTGGLAAWLEAQADKLPDTLSTLSKNALVSKSTQLYRAANRATQYGDFLAKSIYYDHLLSQGIPEGEALALMNEEFVNFSALPGRTRSMLERNGLTWFMAFKIRITKIAMKQMRENPVRAMLLNGITDTGSPIQDNIFTVIGEGRMDYATGFEMLFGAPELNPWVNLMNG